MAMTAHVKELLAPLEDFDQLHRNTVRQFGHRLIDLSYPNPRDHADPRPYRVLADLAASLGPDGLRYSPFGGFTTVRRRVAGALARRHGLRYRYQDVVLTPGATAALNVALQALFTPPDRLIVVTPCWMDYPLYLAHLGLGCDLVSTDRRKHLDLAAIERAWTAHTRGVILSQPASPTGVCYTADELADLAAMMRRLGARRGRAPTLVSDETHRDQVWDNVTFHSPSVAYDRSVSVYSCGKAWEMQGQRTGYLAINPHHPERERLRRQLTAALRVTGHCAPTALMQHLAGALADYSPQLGTLAARQRHVRNRLGGAGHEVVDAHATRFVYVRAPIADARRFVSLAARRGVLVMPSVLFHEHGHYRIALNTDGPDLDRAIDVLVDTTDSTGGARA